jgi:hypothetical protein
MDYFRKMYSRKRMVSELIDFFVGIEECIKQKQWINENSFEILGSQLEPESNGSHMSRIKHEKNVTRKKSLFYF